MKVRRPKLSSRERHWNAQIVMSPSSLWPKLNRAIKRKLRKPMKQANWFSYYKEEGGELCPSCTWQVK